MQISIFRSLSNSEIRDPTNTWIRIRLFVLIRCRVRSCQHVPYDSNGAGMELNGVLLHSLLLKVI